jgi:EAL domain-containing protein (putative c-di-GMP-specific phosphodiesterase class I)
LRTRRARARARHALRELDAAILRDLDCDLHQGYLSGRPMAEDDFASRLLAAERP